METIRVTGKHLSHTYIDPLEVLDKIQKNILGHEGYVYQNDKGEYIISEEYHHNRHIEEKTTKEAYDLYQSFVMIKDRVRKMQAEEKQKWAQNLIKHSFKTF